MRAGENRSSNVPVGDRSQWPVFAVDDDSNPARVPIEHVQQLADRRIERRGDIGQITKPSYDRPSFFLLVALNITGVQSRPVAATIKETLT